MGSEILNDMEKLRCIERAISCEGQKNLHSTWSETKTMARKAARAEAIRSCILVGEHNIPFLLMDHLPAVISHAFPDRTKTARTKTTCIVKHALGPAAQAFYLLTDESTDRGDVKRVGLLVHYYVELCYQVTTGFLGLYDVPHANAANLFVCL